MYVNDLEGHLQSEMKLAIYADDTTVYIDIDRDSDVSWPCAMFQSGVDSISSRDALGKYVLNPPSRKQ